MIDTLNPGNGDIDQAAAFRKRNKIADFAAETKEVVEAAQALVGKRKIELAVEKLLGMEKKARLGGDSKSVIQCCRAILLIYTKQKDFDNLNKYITLLCKRRSQSETAQTNIINFGKSRLLGEIEKLKTGNALVEKERLITTLREVSAGKLMVEVSRAELTMTLSQMKEAAGDINAACELLQEETPETYTSMERKQKIDYILEQIRLCLLIKDFVRSKILLKKIDKQTLEQDLMEDLKIKYYHLVIEYNSNERDPLEVAKAHMALYKTTKNEEEIKCALINLACSKYSNEKVDIIHNILNDHQKKNQGIIEFLHFAKHFVSQEVVQWPFPEHDAIASHPLLIQGAKMAQSTKKNKRNEAMMMEVDDSDEVWRYSMLFDRVIQHDIRVISKYYSTLYLDSLAEMLNLSKDNVEEYISGMVASGDLRVKIDRADGIVNFDLPSTPNDALTDWTANINHLMNLVDKTCHLIHKENMIHDVKE